MGSGSSTRTKRPPRWAPSERELRKYASLFLRTDSDGDGYVDAHEARVLCERSGLAEEVLAGAWHLADRDCDGRLSFLEFAALIHLVTCQLGGLTMPPPHEGIPDDLSAVLGNLRETPQRLAAARSRSNSSCSEASSRSASPAPAPVPHVPSTLPPTPLGPEVPLELHSREDTFAATPSRPSIDTSTQGLEPQQDSALLPPSPRFGTERLRDPKQDHETVKRHLQAALEADRAIAKHLRDEADLLEKQLREARSELAMLLPKAARDQQEEEGLRLLSQRLLRQLEEAKADLGEFKKERAALGKELRSGRLGLELGLLRQACDDEAHLVEETKRATRLLVDSCAGLAEDITTLQALHQELSSRVQVEVELLQGEQGEEVPPDFSYMEQARKAVLHAPAMWSPSRSSDSEARSNFGGVPGGGGPVHQPLGYPTSIRRDSLLSL